jgi:hypothetical protein
MSIKQIEVQHTDGSVAERWWNIEFHADRDTYTEDRNGHRYEVDARKVRRDGDWGIVYVDDVRCLGRTREW